MLNYIKKMLKRNGLFCASYMAQDSYFLEGMALLVGFQLIATLESNTDRMQHVLCPFPDIKL